MNLKAPKISVVIPCFNAEPYIGEAIRSALNQQGFDLEIIVVDDGSTDASAEFVSKRYPQATLIRQNNRGIAHARNAGIEAAQGDWIAFLDADDYWYPNKLARQFAILAHHPESRMCYTAWDVVTADAHPNPSAIQPDDAEKTHPGPSGWIYPELLLDCEVWTSTVLMHRSLLNETGLFDPQLTAGEDWDLWLRASRITPIMRVPIALAAYRQHDANTTHKPGSINHGVLVIRRAIDRWGYSSPDGRSSSASQVNRAIAKSQRSFAGGQIGARNWAVAREAAIEALKLDPLNPSNWKLTIRALLHIPKLRP